MDLHHRYFLNTPYYGYICDNSEIGSAVNGLGTLFNDLHKIPFSGKVELLKGDIDMFQLNKQDTSSGTPFNIVTRKAAEYNKYQYQTVVQIHSQPSHLEYAFIHVNVTKCDAFLHKVKAKSIVRTPVIQHTHHRYLEEMCGRIKFLWLTVCRQVNYSRKCIVLLVQLFSI